MKFKILNFLLQFCFFYEVFAASFNNVFKPKTTKFKLFLKVIKLTFYGNKIVAGFLYVFEAMYLQNDFENK